MALRRSACSRRSSARSTRSVPLSLEDGLALYRTPDIHSLGRMARNVKERKSGKKVFYVLNRYINSTNVCFAGCTFCSFAADEFKEPRARLPHDRRSGFRQGGRDRHELQSDPHRRRTRSAPAFARLLAAADAPLQGRRCRTCNSRSLPPPRSSTWRSATGSRFRRSSRCSRKPGSITSTAARPRSSAKRRARKICPNKVSAANWLAIHEELHRQGIASNATMLYGHIESLEDRVDHLIRLRESQDALAGLQRVHSAGVSSRRQRAVVLRLDDRARRHPHVRRRSPDAATTSITSRRIG